MPAVNDAAASNKVLIQAYKGDASDKKTFVWTKEAFKEKSAKVTESEVVTWSPKLIDMKEILVDQGFVPGDAKEIIGPARSSWSCGNWGITNPEAEAFQATFKQHTRWNSTVARCFHRL